MWRLRIGLLLLLACGCDSNRDAARPAAPPPANRQPITSHSAVPSADAWFEDQTSRAGVTAEYRNGREADQYTLLESIGGGCGLLDYDNDLTPDLFLAGGGRLDAARRTTGLAGSLYRNSGRWMFQNVTAASGVGRLGDYTQGCSTCDYDNDGFPDLLVTAFGDTQFFHNRGDGTFAQISRQAGVTNPGWSTASAWGDVNRDGFPDLWISQYANWNAAEEPRCTDAAGEHRDICSPRQYRGAPLRLFINTGDGGFAAPKVGGMLATEGRGLGLLACDFNADGRLDVYVAHDTLPNELYLTQSDGTFREVGAISGAALGETGSPEGSMGLDLGDYNGDGLADVWVTNFENEDNALYRGEPGGLFRHSTVVAGLGGVGRADVKFGTVFDDFDGDGWQDLFVGSGHVYYHSRISGFAQPPFLYRNRDGRRFGNASDQGGPFFQSNHVIRGCAAGDLDGNGSLDLVIVRQNERPTLLQNRRPPAAWVRLLLRGVQGDRDAIGARVSVQFRGRTLVRWVRSGAGYLSQFDPAILLPVDSEDPAVVVEWLGRDRETFRNLTPRQTHVLIEGHATSR